MGGADDVYRRYRLFANQCDMCAAVTFKSFLLRLLMLVLRTKLPHSVTFLTPQYDREWEGKVHD